MQYYTIYFKYNQLTLERTFRIASNFLNDYSMLECRMAYNSNPIEIISRIVPLLDSKNFKQLLKDNLKGKKSL